MTRPTIIRRGRDQWLAGSRIGSRVGRDRASGPLLPMGATPSPIRAALNPRRGILARLRARLTAPRCLRFPTQPLAPERNR